MRPDTLAVVELDAAWLFEAAKSPAWIMHQREFNMRRKTKLTLTAMTMAMFLMTTGWGLAQRPVGNPPDRIMVWVDREGSVEPLKTPARPYFGPRLSPDGRQVAIEVQGAQSQIWTYDIASGKGTQVTSQDSNRFPLWSPDGKRMLFGSNRIGPMNSSGRAPFFEKHEVFWKAADGDGEAEQLTDQEYRHGPQTFSPDGTLLSFYQIHPTTGRDIWMLPITGDGKPWVYLNTRYPEGGVAFSADSRWFAYTSPISGRYEVYISPFPDRAASRSRVSTDGGTELRWARNGHELFYREGDRRMVVQTSTDPLLIIGKPKLLFEGDFVRSPGTRANYDVTPDGRRFILLQEVR
jgi:Tol biopolymer transport system component